MTNGENQRANNIIPVLIGGAVGGMFPNLIRLSVALVNEKPMPELSYVVGLVLFGLLGGAVAFIWRETDMRRAFYLGIGLPSLIQVGTFEIQKPDQGLTNHDSGYILQESEYVAETNWLRAFGFILPSLHAEEPPLPNQKPEDQPAIPNRKLMITSETPLPPYVVLFLSEDASDQKWVTIDHADPDTLYPRRDMINAIIEVPGFASHFEIRIRDSNVVREALTPVADDTLMVKLALVGKRWSGFLQSLGLTEIKSRKLTIKQKDIKKFLDQLP